jgi:hypothetical protein
MTRKQMKFFKKIGILEVCLYNMIIQQDVWKHAPMVQYRRYREPEQLQYNGKG